MANFRFFKSLHSAPGATKQDAAEDLLVPLGETYRSALLSMYRGEPQLGTDGTRHAIDPLTRISPSQGMALYGLYASIKPRFSLEVGMAYGFSTVYFLAAIAQNRMGHHTAIDPFQESSWKGIGLVHARTLAPTIGATSAFRLIGDRSDRAATDLARMNAAFDFIFIDGNHRFDNVVVDFHLCAHLCALDGHIVFDDMWMKSVKTAVAFVRSNRLDFVEVDGQGPNICVFRKVSQDLRSWDHFQAFSVAR